MWGNAYRSHRRLRLGIPAVIAIILSIAFMVIIVFCALSAADQSEETAAPQDDQSMTIAEYNNASGFGDSSVTVDRQGRIID